MGKMSIRNKVSVEHWRMKKRPAVNRGSTQPSSHSRRGAGPLLVECALLPRHRPRTDVAAAGTRSADAVAAATAVGAPATGIATATATTSPGRRPGRHPGGPSGGQPGPPPGKSLNWSLRRYVRASSLRVWLMRRMLEARGVPGPAARPAGAIAGRNGLHGHCDARGSRPAAAGKTHPPAPGERVCGGLRCRRRSSRRNPCQNGQKEYSTLMAGGLRGGIQRSAAIASRERARALDLQLATLCNSSCVQSNTFKFVMT
jgi:hypothetical protein